MSILPDPILKRRRVCLVEMSYSSQGRGGPSTKPEVQLSASASDETQNCMAGSKTTMPEVGSCASHACTIPEA